MMYIPRLNFFKDSVVASESIKTPSILYIFILREEPAMLLIAVVSETVMVNGALRLPNTSGIKVAFSFARKVLPFVISSTTNVRSVALSP